MKPQSPNTHNHLAKWIRNGGVVVYVSRDDDPYQSVAEWWNTKNNNYKTPLEHLKKILGIKTSTGQNIYQIGKGKFIILKKNPNEFVITPNSDSNYVQLIKDSYENFAKAGILQFKNNFYLERGNYILASVMDEINDTTSMYLEGPVIDLFNPELPVLSEKILKPAEHAFLYDLKKVDKKKPKVLCSASRIYNELFKTGFYSFIAKGPSGTWNVMMIFLPTKPQKADVLDISNNLLNNVEYDWDEKTKTLRLQFPNNSDGVNVSFAW